MCLVTHTTSCLQLIASSIARWNSVVQIGQHAFGADKMYVNVGRDTVAQRTMGVIAPHVPERNIKQHLAMATAVNVVEFWLVRNQIQT